MFRWAEDEGLLPKNPIRRLRPCWDTPQPRGACKPDEYAAIMKAARRPGRLAVAQAGPGKYVRRDRRTFRAAMHFLWSTGAKPAR
jgi:hypothetical protein